MGIKTFWSKVKKFFNFKNLKNKNERNKIQNEVINYLNKIYKSSKGAKEYMKNFFEDFDSPLELKTLRTKFKNIETLFDENDIKSLIYWVYIKGKYNNVVVKNKIIEQTRFVIPIFLDIDLNKESSFDNEYARRIFRNPKIGDFFYLVENEVQTEFKKVGKLLKEHHNSNFKEMWFGFTKSIYKTIKESEGKYITNKSEGKYITNKINGLIGEFYIALNFDNLKKQKSDKDDLEAILNKSNSNEKIVENPCVNKINWNSLTVETKNMYYDLILFYSFKKSHENFTDYGQSDLRVEVKSSSKNYVNHEKKEFDNWLNTIIKNEGNNKKYWTDTITFSWNEIEGFFTNKNFILVKNYNISYEWEKINEKKINRNKNKDDSILSFWIKTEHMKKLIFIYFVYWEYIYKNLNFQNNNKED